MQLPEYDTHFAKSVKKGHYQRAPLLIAMAYTRNWKVAVDAGAHVGFISVDMAKFFGTVHAFEPCPDNFDCLIENVQENVVPHAVALGAKKGRAGLKTPALHNSGAWMVGEGDTIEVGTLDSYELEDVGLIKIDTQGAEYSVLSGAVATLLRCKPVVLMECVGKVEDPRAAKFMSDLGATHVATIRQDGIWVF